jgi:glycosyltransferase involved in cell wall biosynthesis
MLIVLERHPVQYHAPVYRELQQRFGVPVTVLYGSDLSVTGYRDAEFGTTIAWDTDLMSGYGSEFLTRSAGQDEPERIDGAGLAMALRARAQVADAVMVVGYGTPFDRRAWYAAWRSGLPILFRGETSDHAVQRSPLKTRLRDSALRTAYGRAAALLYIGQHSREHCRRLTTTRVPLFFSPYCVDATPFRTDEESRLALRPAGRAELGAGPDDHVLLFSGKLSRRKGVDLLIDAVRGLPSDLRRRTVIGLLGDGELRDDLVRESAALRIKAVGFRNQRELSRYYHAADLVVLPSRYSETWGLVINEALLHGVPAVVSDAVGCAPDLVIPGHTGFVCTVDSAESLTGALARALTDLVGRDDIRAECRRHVAAYSVTEAARGIADAYRTVAMSGALPIAQ